MSSGKEGLGAGLGFGGGDAWWPFQATQGRPKPGMWVENSRVVSEGGSTTEQTSLGSTDPRGINKKKIRGNKRRSCTSRRGNC